MFNSDFYPTPDAVLDHMLYGTDLTGKIVLEPSAGKGNIVDYLHREGVSNVIACEKDPELKKFVANKCRIIADDFLSINADQISHIDYIVMNPPFSADDKHIIHAFEIAPPGCVIFALCNWETYNHNYTNERRRFSYLVRENGSCECLGDVFSDAERKTDVKIGFVKLTKPGGKAEDFEGFFMDEEPDESGAAAGIMPYNAVRDLVNRYIGAIKLFDKQLELAVQMNNLTNGFFSSSVGFSCTLNQQPIKREEYIKDLQKSAWKWVFAKFKLEKFTTKGLEAKINNFVERQTNVPFTMKNIYKMIEIIIGTIKPNMDEAIIEIFDRFTQHYHDNRYNVEGWKTNSHYLLGQKIIVPYAVRQGGISTTYMERTYSNHDKSLDDLMKVLCFITGTNYETQISWHSFFYQTDHEAEAREKEKHGYCSGGRYIRYDFGKWYDWGFFQIKGFKKGTLHMKFKNLDHWAMFNQEVSRIKGYPLFEHSSYEDTRRERTEKSKKKQTA